MIKVSTYKCLSRFIIIIIIIFPTFCHGCFSSRSSVWRVKACLLQHNSVAYAVFVFVAASRNDQAPQVSIPALLVVSVSRQLQKRKGRNCFSYAFASWCVYANLRVCLCVCEQTYVQEYAYGRQNIYNTTWIQCVIIRSFGDFVFFLFFCLTVFFQCD